MDHLDFDIVSDLDIRISDFNHSGCFMQNKANFRKSQMNVSIFSKMDYENIANWTLGENKPNSKPIKANPRKAKMNVNSLIAKDYRKKDDFAVPKNKPNTNPKQTQFKPKTDPKQTQSNPTLSADLSGEALAKTEALAKSEALAKADSKGIPMLARHAVWRAALRSVVLTEDRFRAGQV